MTHTAPMRSHLAVLALLVPALAACGSSDESDGASAADLADQIQSAVPESTERIEVTEDNDSNDLIGRPGQYDAAIFLADERLDCDAPGYDQLAASCGAKIEAWPDEDAAQARADDIQSKLSGFGLGAEYNYVVGRMLVRVSGDLKPSEAEAYEQAVTE